MNGIDERGKGQLGIGPAGPGTYRGLADTGAPRVEFRRQGLMVQPVLLHQTGKGGGERPFKPFSHFTHIGEARYGRTAYAMLYRSRSE